MANRLINETSPYLLQHAHNPVDWYPWGEEAFQRARDEDKPILLSVGYSACHWCHVMERESFENPDIARIMNEHFVNVKVDREERPDVDALYMAAVQAMTGHGGWPMTVFLTPDGKPFYGGTYFPPDDRGAMPGFPRVLLAVAEAYRTQRDQLVQQAERVAEYLRRVTAVRGQPGEPDAGLLDGAFSAMAAQFDSTHGGFGGAPKFPQAMSLEFLLRYYRRTKRVEALRMVEVTLQQMGRGGIYDQLGGGFHRYSVDARWLVPHFEKMLYDNALLSRVYLHAYQVTGNPFYRRIVEETLDYVAREMLAPEGGFYATQDADSEGEEGKFYVWVPGEILSVLGAREGRLILQYYGVTQEGNFEGKNVLHVPRPLDEVAEEVGVSAQELAGIVERGRRALLQNRARRVWPGRDEKIVTSWNGLMMRSFAEAAGALGREEYRRIAIANANFLLAHLRQGERLFHTWKDGVAKVPGFLEDYACLVDGLLALHEATGDLRWLVEARALADTMVRLFWDDAQQTFFDTPADHEPLVARPRDVFDNATPSGTSVACDALLRLAVLFGEDAYRRRAVAVLRQLRDLMASHPTAFGHALGALDTYLGEPIEIAVVGEPDAPETRALLAPVHRAYLPNRVVAVAARPDEAVAHGVRLLEGRVSQSGRATAYLCRQYVCQAPAVDPQSWESQLASVI
ncbi:MAG TPA: thioredoxin domain-containing protein [Chloroflexota bacterium]